MRIFLLDVDQLDLMTYITSVARARVMIKLRIQREIELDDVARFEKYGIVSFDCNLFRWFENWSN